MEKEVQTWAEGLDKLLTQYGVTPPPYRLEGHTLHMDGAACPLFPWRAERRFQEMKKMTQDGTLGSLVSIRAVRTAQRRETLDEILYREIDLCLWWSEKTVVNVFAVVNGACANAIIRLSDGVICILEAAAQLADGAEACERHELITDHGMATDQAIDTLVKQQSVYAYVAGKPERTYTDVDFELFGLDASNVALTRSVYDALCGRVDARQAAREDARIRAVLAAIKESARAQCVVALEEGKQ